MVTERIDVHLAAFCRSALRLVKYRAEPSPVRKAEGTVPRQRDRTAFGLFHISLNEARRELSADCCTRVFKRSAGWRRMADSTPELNPAKKWKASYSLSVAAGCAQGRGAHKMMQNVIDPHLT
jgi:hypothetical protein